MVRIFGSLNSVAPLLRTLALLPLTVAPCRPASPSSTADRPVALHLARAAAVVLSRHRISMDQAKGLTCSSSCQERCFDDFLLGLRLNCHRRHCRVVRQYLVMHLR
uniref:Secreted protein n=1 Tax=Oryza nivara TaxID=4536 RepID=A0A0E0HY95_ORYNI